MMERISSISDSETSFNELPNVEDDPDHEEERSHETDTKQSGNEEEEEVDNKKTNIFQITKKKDLMKRTQNKALKNCPNKQQNGHHFQHLL
ncbi:hypothetical protein QE152_g24904 [Popillia japonica]|uniref:Uncharacterized protein n=1 Tax=Popillia japonica TaxID=7064 RepID=A0AAW1K384_POPJA